MRADEAFKLLEQYTFKTVLDVGAGPGEHATAFRKLGKQVTTVDVQADNKPDLIGAWPYHVNVSHQYELFWASHILEHQPNVQEFLQAIDKVTVPHGIIAITVPPLKHFIVGGHLTLWNAGLLLYNLVMAGYNCREARVLKYGYNISVVMLKKMIPKTQLALGLHYDKGDIEKLADYFPMTVQQGFWGDFEEVNWHGFGTYADASPPTVIKTPST